MKIIALCLLFIGLVLFGLFYRFRKNKFLTQEADRCLNKYCEIDKNWSSRGRVYARSLTVIEEGGEKRFVKQAKLFDIGILK